MKKDKANETVRHYDPDRMSADELHQLYADAEKVTDAGVQPMTAADRSALRKAARRGQRPRGGSEAKRINISVERSLLNRADDFARRHGLTRAAVIAAGLKKIVA